MTTKSELATLAALAIINGADVRRIAPGERAIPLSHWYNNDTRVVPEHVAQRIEARALSANFAGRRVYRGYR